MEWSGCVASVAISYLSTKYELILGPHNKQTHKRRGLEEEQEWGKGNAYAHSGSMEFPLRFYDDHSDVLCIERIAYDVHLGRAKILLVNRIAELESFL